MAFAVDKTSLGTHSAGANQASIALTTAAAVAAGGLIEVAVAGFVNGGVAHAIAFTASGGGLTWATNAQQPASGTASTDHVAICSALAPAGLISGTVITVTFAGDNLDGPSIVAMSFTGSVTSTPFDIGSGASSATGTATSAGTMATVTAGDLVVGAFWGDGTNATLTAGGGYTKGPELADATNGDSLTLIYQLNVAGGSFNPTGTWSSSQVTNRGVGGSYKAAATAGGIWLPQVPAHRQPLPRPTRGRSMIVVPAQIPVPVVSPRFTQPTGRRMLALRRGRQTNPVLTQSAAAPPTRAPSKVGATARKLGLMARGKQWSSATLSGLSPITPPLIYSPLTTAGRQFRRVLARKSRRADPPWGQTHSLRSPLQRPRARALLLRRGRQASPVPASQIAPLAPVWPNRVPALARRLFALQPRGKQPFPVQPQIPVPSPAVPRTATRWRWAAVRRGRLTNPVLTQAATPPPTYPPPRLGASRRLLSGVQRGRAAQPISVSPQPIPVRAPAIRRLVTLAVGKRSTVPPAQQTPAPTPVFPNRFPARRLLSRPGRSRGSSVTPGQVPVPKWPPRWLRTLPRPSLLRRGHKAEPPWPQEFPTAFPPMTAAAGDTLEAFGQAGTTLKYFAAGGDQAEFASDAGDTRP